MGGHVVGALGGVDEEAVAVGNDFRHEGFEVAADIRVGIFLDEERCGGVLDVEGAEAVLKFGAREFTFDLVGEVNETSAVCLDLDFRERLFHFDVLASCSRR